MKKVNNGISKALSRIPPIFSKSTIRIVERDLKTFFRSPNRRYKYSLPLLFTYFTPEAENGVELTAEDQHQLETILSMNVTQAILLLSKNPTLCRAACISTNVLMFTEYYSKDIYNEFVALALFGQSADLLNFLLFKVIPPKPPLWPKPRFSKAIPWLLGPSDMPLFAPIKDKRFLTFPSPIHKINEKNRKAKNNTERPIFLSHSSAFAASHNQLFFGLNNGIIIVEPYPPKNEYCQPYTMNIGNLLNDRLYSLAWALDSLWIFTETNIYCVDVSNSSLSSLKSNSSSYFPVFTDGYYFYTPTSMNRVITVFTINRGQIKIIRKVRLEKPIDRLSPFITNGLFFTFADVQENARYFIQFSAVNGSLIREFRCDFQTTEFSFCISPYRQHHFVLTNYKFEAYSDNFQLPRWIMGLSFPESHLSDLTTVFNSVYFALYHDKKIFSDTRYDSILEMATNYVNSNDQYGVILSAMFLCHSVNRLQIDIFNQYFMKSKSEARMFLCIVFLLCYSDKRMLNQKNELPCIKLPNIINTFIEEEYPPTFIWLFPKFFNFRRIELSAKGIIKLITYVTGQSTIFPDESFFIMSSFLKYAFANILNDPEKFISPINAITISIEQKIISLNDKKGINDRFIKSTVDYKIWTELLLIIYQNRQSWIYCSSMFVKFLDFGLLNNRQYCGELNRMLNCTLYIFLCLFSNISFVIYPRFFKSLDDFFKQFPHTLNGVYISIDKKIFKLLSQCNDIPSKEEFSKYFFSLRNYFIFESPSVSYATIPISLQNSGSSMLADSPSQAFDKLLNTIQDKQYSIKGVIKYIFENDPRELIQLQNQSIIEWFILLFESKKLNECQQCIFSIFLDTFEKIKPLLIEAVKIHSAHYFIKSFSYPFLLPPELFLNVSDITCNVQEIINYPLQLLRLSYKNIIKCHKKINDSTMIVLPLIDRFLKDSGDDPVLLFDTSLEPLLYHDLILWLIGYKWGEIIDFRTYIFSFVVLLRNGSKREIRATMKWLYIAEFFNDFNIDNLFHEILDIIGDYLLSMKNPFYMIKDPFDVSETIFTMIHYCRKLFNLQTDIFRKYLLKYIDLNNKKTVIATFAILNNSIDIFRRNTHLTVLDNNFILKEGKVRESDIIDENSDDFNRINCVKIKSYDKKTTETIVLNNCIQIWANPKRVDLSLLFSNVAKNSTEKEKLINKFQKMFSDVEFEYNYQNTFKLAALNSFLELKLFKDSLSDEFKQSFISIKDDEWPNYYMMDRSYLDFTYFLAISHSSSSSSKINGNSFCFIKDNEFVFNGDEGNDTLCFEDFGIDFKEEDFFNEISNDNHTEKLKGSQNLIALDKKACFKSPPLHPRLHSKLSFGFDNPAFYVEIYGITDINHHILRYGPITAVSDSKVNNSNNNEKIEIPGFDIDDEFHYLLLIEIIPNKSTINISIGDYDNNKVKEINILIPPLKMIYISLNLECGTICNSTYEIDQHIFDFNEIEKNIFNCDSLSNYCCKNENCYFDKMTIVKNEKVPLATYVKNPGFYEFTSLELASQKLNLTLKQLNAIEIMDKFPSSALLNFLFYSNPILSNKCLNFKKMISIPLWMTTSEKLRNIVLDQINKEKLKEMEEEIKNRRNSWPSVDIRYNQSFVFTKGVEECNNTDKINRKLFFSNCFLMTNSRYIMLGLHESKVHFPSGMIIFPYLGINSTSLEIAINCRHLIACYRFLGISEFSVTQFFESIPLSDEAIFQSCSALISANNSLTNLPISKISSSSSSTIYYDDISNSDFVDYIGYNYLKSKAVKSISIFGEIRAFAELIFPQIPKEGEKPIFHDESLLIPESSAHDYPNIFFFNKYFELVSPRYHQQVFSLSSKSPMYFTTTSDTAKFEINNRSFTANQFAILYNKSDQLSLNYQGVAVQRSFKVKSEDKDDMFIYDAIPNFAKIESEFKNWKSQHSFQLLLSIDSEVELKMVYKKLPLSTKFSFEMIYFMFQLLKKHKLRIKDKIEHFESQINILVKSDQKIANNNINYDASSNALISINQAAANQIQSQNISAYSNINPYLNPYSHSNQSINSNPNMITNPYSSSNQSLSSSSNLDQNLSVNPNLVSKQNQNQNPSANPNLIQNQNPSANPNLIQKQNSNINPNSFQKQSQNQNPSANPNFVQNQNPSVNQNLVQNQNQNPNSVQKQNQNPNINPDLVQNPNPNVNPNFVQNPNLNANPNLVQNQNPHLNPHLNTNIYPHVNINAIPHISHNQMNVHPYLNQNHNLQPSSSNNMPLNSAQNLSSTQNLSLNQNSTQHFHPNSTFNSNIQLSTTQISNSTLNSSIQLGSNTNINPNINLAQVQNPNPILDNSELAVYQNSAPNVYSNSNPNPNMNMNNANNNSSPYLHARPYSYSNLNFNSPTNPYSNLNTNIKSSINLDNNPAGNTYSQLKQFIDSNGSISSIDDNSSSSSFNIDLKENQQADTFSTLNNFVRKNKNANQKMNENLMKATKNASNEKLIPSIDISKSQNKINENKNDFYYPLNLRRKGENAKFVKKINSSFKFAQELGEFSVKSIERVDFLKGLRMPCSIFDCFDPQMVHIFTSFKESCKKVEQIKKDISFFFRTQNMSQQSLSYLQKFIQSSPNFVVLLFIEFCTGESAISKWPIYVISVNNEGILRTSQEDHLLVIGKFKSYDSFSNRLLILIQNYQDDLVV